MRADEFFALPPSLQAFAAHFSAEAPVWDWIKAIKSAVTDLKGNTSERELPPGVVVEGEVWLDPTVKLPGHATLIGPAYIGAGTEIRPGAYVRGNVIVGAGAVLGNSCEFKNCLLLDGVQVPHFSYVGDSVLGNKAHLGAGVILSNLRLDQAEVLVHLPDRLAATGLRKMGAILGDAAEVGCNAVLQPGTLLGPRALVMPTLAFGGYLPAGQLAKGRTSVVVIPRRD
ncbi:UDP-N-acetylglucosamine diphosphorylase [Actomonas aquatica]|uniref:UDP-N-acetylglucosamine diphosphorylase n=1 Tax=Actomonas aquatica TaxID=2866162 RepID=A0ABZ1CAH6_9BACT|nr:UDP-N-acetylglucosamine diphosphorylase [Opitutus sp. WL0086]WRQ87594.1 UDP-N-acetylglucosamine diphosphorylase [Opitutus sp. WL0086]